MQLYNACMAVVAVLHLCVVHICITPPTGQLILTERIVWEHVAVL